MTATAIQDGQTKGHGVAHSPDDHLPKACEVWQLPGRSRWSPREARNRAVELCRSQGLEGETADDLAVIVTELTTNAIVHAPSDTVCVSVILDACEAHVLVIDQGCDLPSSNMQPEDDEHGRGLFLVEELSDRFVRLSAGDGTVAWAHMSFG